MKSFYNRMALLLPAFFLWVVALQAQSPQTFSYTGAEQIFTVPNPLQQRGTYPDGWQSVIYGNHLFVTQTIIKIDG